MRPFLRLGASLIAFGALALPANTARASDDVGVIILGVSVVSAAFGADVAFTAYDIGKVRKNQEPDSKWMTAQTIVTSPQAVLGHVPLILATVDKGDSEAFGLFLPLAIWGNQMATYGAWSMASQESPPAARYGVSWLIGADLPLTTTAFSGFFTDNHYTRPWHSVSELALCTPQVAYGIYQGVHDPGNRGEWIGIAAWSGTLVVHGAVSLILAMTHKEESPVEPTPPLPPPQPPVPPRPPPYYYDDPVKVVPNDPDHPVDPGKTPTQREPAPPSTTPPFPSPPPHAPKLHADIAPTPITDGFRVVPGVTVFGSF